MADNLPMTKEEKSIIDGLINQGPKTISPKNIELLANALIKATPDLYKKACDIILKNAELNKAVIDKFSELSKSAISSENENVKKIFDTAADNCSVIRELLRQKNLKPEQLKVLLDELRYHAQTMHDVNNEHHEHHKAILEEEHKVAKEAQDNNKLGIGVAIGSIVTAILGGIISLIIHNNNNNNNNNNTPA